MHMWASWNIDTTLWLPAMALFALTLCLPLSRIAYWLPRSLDSSVPVTITPAHRRYRLGFCVGAIVVALACAWHFGATPVALAAMLYGIVLLTLAWIDAETGFLPDALTLPLLWLGLLVNLAGAFSPLADAVLGAVAGYMSLWLINGAFLLLTGRRGMGNGDFKLLAALGAWLGWMPLPWILLSASLLALTVALFRRLAGLMKAGEPFSFGPYLAVVGIVALLRL